MTKAHDDDDAASSDPEIEAADADMTLAVLSEMIDSFEPSVERDGQILEWREAILPNKLRWRLLLELAQPEELAELIATLQFAIDLTAYAHNRVLADLQKLRTETGNAEPMPTKTTASKKFLM